LYIEANDGSGKSELDVADVAKVIKVNHYYPKRATSSYADFDRKTWIARLGMGHESTADQEVGVVANQLPDVLNAVILVEGDIKNEDKNSLLGLRVDYEVNGKYTKSILYHGSYKGTDVFSLSRTSNVPWGTKKIADQVIKVSDLSNFKLTLKENAPQGWNGKAHISFIMENTGAGTRAKITLRK
jgi:hypothetical protein